MKPGVQMADQCVRAVVHAGEAMTGLAHGLTLFRVFGDKSSHAGQLGQRGKGHIMFPGDGMRGPVR